MSSMPVFSVPSALVACWQAPLQARGAAAELYETLEAAVAACRERATAGDSVLLSPGCASWGMFEDYRARGAAFTRCVERIAAQGG